MATPPDDPAVLPLHPLLATRRSPRAFDPATDVTSRELATLLEAARWAPSNRNTQPWRFLVGRRDDDTHKHIHAALAAGNQRWAGRAPVLLVGAHLTHDDEGQPLPYALYDLGQAVAHLTVQATALELYVHQMAGFDKSVLHRELELPERVWPTVVVAVGRLGDADELPDDLREREVAPRRRQRVARLLLN